MLRSDKWSNDFSWQNCLPFEMKNVTSFTLLNDAVNITTIIEAGVYVCQNIGKDIIFGEKRQSWNCNSLWGKIDFATYESHSSSLRNCFKIAKAYNPEDL